MAPAEGKQIILWVKGQQRAFVYGHEGIKGNQMYSSFFSQELDGGEWSTPSCGRLTPKNDPVPTV
jgi:hypothetical protein